MEDPRWLKPCYRASSRPTTLDIHRYICSAWFGGLRLLFLTSAHAADFIFTRQAEGEERARGLRWTDKDNVG